MTRTRTITVAVPDDSGRGTAYLTGLSLAIHRLSNGVGLPWVGSALDDLATIIADAAHAQEARAQRPTATSSPSSGTQS